jgi:hypothetical protein
MPKQATAIPIGAISGYCDAPAMSESGHELPRRSLAIAAAVPPNAAAPFVHHRGRSAPKVCEKKDPVLNRLREEDRTNTGAMM